MQSGSETRSVALGSGLLGFPVVRSFRSGLAGGSALRSGLARGSALRSGLARFRLSNHASDGYGTSFFDVRGPDSLGVSKTPGQILGLARIGLPNPNEVRGFVPKPSLVYFPSSLFAITERSALEGEGVELSKRKAAALSVKAGWVLLLSKRTGRRLSALAAEAGWLGALAVEADWLGGCRDAARPLRPFLFPESLNVAFRRGGSMASYGEQTLLVRCRRSWRWRALTRRECHGDGMPGAEYGRAWGSD